MGGIRFEADGDGHDHHRHARLRPGPRDAVRAGAVRASSASRSSSIRLLQGDSDQLIAGGGTGGSQLDAWRAAARSSKAGDKVIEQGKQIAAHVLEASARRHRVRATAASPSPAPTARSASWSWPQRLRDGLKLPPRACRSRSTSTTSIDERALGLPQRLPRRRGRDRSRDRRDRGRALHHGQRFRHRHQPDARRRARLHGGVVQGIGQALMERTVYDDARPARSPAPSWTTRCRAPPTRRCSRSTSHPVPATTNPLGAKGCGEAGCAGALPSVMNARGRRAVGVRRHAHRHAGDPAAGLGGDPGGALKSLSRRATALIPLLARVRLTHKDPLWGRAGRGAPGIGLPVEAGPPRISRRGKAHVIRPASAPAAARLESLRRRRAPCPAPPSGSAFGRVRLPHKGGGEGV